jgi:hypothetical protein
MKSGIFIALISYLVCALVYVHLFLVSIDSVERLFTFGFPVSQLILGP